ncbi:hypothetical protein N9N67_12230, partial [Bacteriovoracaceae bacterium]|nr:hypothetical protein [Bacteriovoracaceae bacterium]
GDIDLSVSLEQNNDVTREIDISMLKDNRRKIDPINIFLFFLSALLSSLNYFFITLKPSFKKYIFDLVEFYFGLLVLCLLGVLFGCILVILKEGSLKVLSRQLKYNEQVKVILIGSNLIFFLSFFEELINAYTFYSGIIFELLISLVFIHYAVRFINLLLPYSSQKLYWKHLSFGLLMAMGFYITLFYNVVIVEREGRFFERFNTQLNFYMPYISPLKGMSDLEKIMDDVDQKTID